MKSKCGRLKGKDNERREEDEPRLTFVPMNDARDLSLPALSLSPSFANNLGDDIETQASWIQRLVSTLERSSYEERGEFSGTRLIASCGSFYPMVRDFFLQHQSLVPVSNTFLFFKPCFPSFPKDSDE
jgi:hypothetical protein